MPEISRFFGIVIKMFYDDHNPPHFHAEYGDGQGVKSALGSLRLIREKVGSEEGRLSGRVWPFNISFLSARFTSSLKVGNARFWLGENSPRIGYIRYTRELAQFMADSEEKKIIEHFKREVTKALEDRLDRIVLFGSRARGDADDESDFDFLVALRKVEKEDKDKIQKIASDLSLKYNIVITALVIPSEDFREDRYFYLYENIQKEGQVV